MRPEFEGKEISTGMRYPTAECLQIREPGKLGLGKPRKIQENRSDARTKIDGAKTNTLKPCTKSNFDSETVHHLNIRLPCWL